MRAFFPRAIGGCDILYPDDHPLLILYRQEPGELGVTVGYRKIGVYGASVTERLPIGGDIGQGAGFGGHWFGFLLSVVLPLM